MTKRIQFILLTAILGISLQANGQSFTRMETEAGLELVSTNNGVAVADYDLDGDLDIFFVAYGSFLYPADSTWNRLMRNQGDGTFEDVTLEAGFSQQFFNSGIPAARGEKMGAAWGDYDNDGYPDLFLTNSRKDQLFHNNGDGSFSDVSVQAGVEGCQECYSGSAMWWDYDVDGDLDVYVTVLNGSNILYENLGDGTFDEVTEQVGLGSLTITWASIAMDVNGDGYPDLYDINDTQENQLWENRAGKSFQDVAAAYRLNDDGAGMGVAIGDYNNDGLFDLYITQIYAHKPNPLFRNDGTRRFTNKAVELGVDNTGWGWGTQFLDYDHDGDEDLYAVNGPIDKLNGITQDEVNNYFFKNTLTEGIEGFSDWSAQSGADALTSAKGMEVFDYDGDGDLDMIVANQHESPFLYQNQTIQQVQNPDKNWLQVRLTGSISNHNAFGTTVIATIEGQSYYRYHHGAGFFGQSIKPVHFGMGSATTVDQLVILWPSGLRDTVHNVAANQIIDVLETPGNPGTNPGVPIESRVQGIKAFPNPFGNTTSFEVKTARPSTVSIRIVNSTGAVVERLEHRMTEAGTVEIPWGNSSTDTKAIATGIYHFTAEITSDVDRQRVHGKIAKITD